MDRLVDKHLSKMENAYRWLWAHPELGYREWKSHGYMADAFRKLGYALVEAGDIPGFYTDVDTGRSGPHVLVMGELDALICFAHPESDKQTGAVHACGHCAQCAALLGIAAVLKEPDALEGLSGKIRLMAVPNEEDADAMYSEALMRKGIIRYAHGKPEFLRRGYMDGIDLAFMMHTASGPSHSGCLFAGSNGIMRNTATIWGKAAHSGYAEHLGVNALHAAAQAINAINAIQFQVPGGSVNATLQSDGPVNVIPDKVVISTSIRGNSIQTIGDLNGRVKRAIAGAAVSLGANVSFQERMGCLPRIANDAFNAVFQEAMDGILVDVREYKGVAGGCSDIGDLQHLMPALHPNIGGAVGTGHSANWYVNDINTACGDAARVQLRALRILLENGARRANALLKEFKPVFASKQEYFSYVDDMNQASENVVTYGDDIRINISSKR